MSYFTKDKDGVVTEIECPHGIIGDPCLTCGNSVTVVNLGVIDGVILVGRDERSAWLVSVSPERRVDGNDERP